MPIGAVTQGWPCLPRRDAGRASGLSQPFGTLTLLFPTLSSTSLPRVQPAVSADGSPSPPARARLVRRDGEDKDNLGVGGIWRCKLEHKRGNWVLEQSARLWAWPHPKTTVIELLLLVAGASGAEVLGLPVAPSSSEAEKLQYFPSAAF